MVSVDVKRHVQQETTRKAPVAPGYELGTTERGGNCGKSQKEPGYELLMYNYILELECVEIHATGDCLCFGCFMLQIVMKKIRSRSKE